MLTRHVDDALLQSTDTFDKAEFVSALTAAGQRGAEDEEVYQRVLQQCKRDGKIKADATKRENGKKPLASRWKDLIS